jgi:PIN domain nuclease of toxin-antitoxin system
LRLLLDTHIVIWWLDDQSGIPSPARRAIREPKNDVFVSAATAWEMAIKHAQGKLRTPGNLERELRAESIVELPITLEHAVAAGALPLLHDDPFDRMLIAQTQLEQLTLVTVDRVFRRYEVAVLGV